MYFLRTAPRPFTPSECRDLPEEDRPVFDLIPISSGSTHDTRAEAMLEDETPIEQDAICRECGERIKVKVRMRLPGQMSQEKFVHGMAARVIVSVRNFDFETGPTPWPKGMVDRVRYVRRLPPTWVQEIAEAAKHDTELDPEEEREGSDSAPSS